MLKYDIKNNETPEICEACGGKCCRGMGCAWSVKDFEREFGDVNEENIRKALDSGLIAIDWWEGDYRDDYDDLNLDRSTHDDVSRSFYIRMRHVNEPAVFGSWGGRCVALTETGCKFDWDHRPLGGKSLVGSFIGWRTRNCEIINQKIEFVADWFPFNDLLEVLATNEKYFEDPFVRIQKLLEMMEQKEGEKCGE